MASPGKTPRPRLLDLFCGAGGAAMGYHRAGFDVVGVDIRPQPRYPFAFVQADALDVLRQWGDNCEFRQIGETCDDQISDLVGAAAVGIGRFDVQVDEDFPHGSSLVGVASDSPKPARVVKAFDAVHASPPCQAYSQTQRLHGVEHPELIEPVRDLLAASGLPYVIENVVGAPLRDPAVLCGSMFGLDVRRHRLFETTFPVMAPTCHHDVWRNTYPTHSRKDKAQTARTVPVYGTGGGAGKDLGLWRRVMEVEWMQTKAEVAEAIPPAYTELIGHQLMQHLSFREVERVG